jgi:hypothetical protein
MVNILPKQLDFPPVQSPPTGKLPYDNYPCHFPERARFASGQENAFAPDVHRNIPITAVTEETRTRLGEMEVLFFAQ